jgi:phage pi2 protein 07
MGFMPMQRGLPDEKKREHKPEWLPSHTCVQCPKDKILVDIDKNCYGKNQKCENFSSFYGWDGIDVECKFNNGSTLDGDKYVHCPASEKMVSADKECSKCVYLKEWAKNGNTLLINCKYRR